MHTSKCTLRDSYKLDLILGSIQTHCKLNDTIDTFACVQILIRMYYTVYDYQYIKQLFGNTFDGMQSNN